MTKISLQRKTRKEKEQEVGTANSMLLKNVLKLNLSPIKCSRLQTRLKKSKAFILD